MKAWWIKLIGFVVLCELAGLFGSLFTINSIPQWYNYLIKPQFAPPNWVFGPVWTVLYLLMGIAGYILWQNRRVNRRSLNWFFVQLVLNILWTPLFFSGHALGWAFAEIIVMWLAIGATIFTAYRSAKSASILLMPYWAWVSFAAILNFYIWHLN